MLRHAGLGLLGLATGKVFVIDLAAMDVAYRAVVLAALGLLLLVSAYLFTRLPRRAGGADGRHRGCLRSRLTAFGENRPAARDGNPENAGRGSSASLYHPAPMRRAGPILIIVIGLLALLVDFVRLPMPSAGPQTSGDATYSRRSSASTCEAASGSSTRCCPRRARSRPGTTSTCMRADHRQPRRQVGRRRAAGRGPGHRPDRDRDAGHPERGPDPCSSWAPPAASTSCPLGRRPASAGPARSDLEGLPAAVLRRRGRQRRHRRQPDRPAHGRLRAQGPRASSCSPTTRRSMSASTSRSCSTARSSAPRSSTRRSPAARSRSARTAIGGYPLAEAQNLVTILQFGQLPFPA